MVCGRCAGGVWEVCGRWARGSEKKEMDYRQKNERLLGKKTNVMAKFAKKIEKTFLELAKGFWRVKIAQNWSNIH